MKDVAQQIKARLPLSSVVKEVVSLRGRDPNFVGLCPFHEEKTPSFHVRNQAGRFKCFGCGASGDVFEFLMRLRGITFKEAMLQLAERASISLGPKVSKPKDSPSEALLKIQACAQRYFVYALTNPKQGDLALRYVKQQRGLNDAMIKQAGIGYGSSKQDGLFLHLRQHGFSAQQAIDAGLLKSNHEPYFLSRITFPIRDLEGKIVAFGARSFGAQDQGPKYVNTHTYAHYEKRKSFYGLFESKSAILKGQPPFLVEGYFDAMALWALGLPALALCGTALTEQHVAMLASLSKRVVFCFDGDQAGLRALKHALLLAYSFDLEPRGIFLPEQKDPGDFLAKNDLETLRPLLTKPADALSVLIDQSALVAGTNIENRMRELDDLIPIFARIKRPLLRRQYVMYMANRLHEDASLLWTEVERRIKSLAITKSNQQKPEVPAIANLSSDERFLLQICLADPKKLDDIMELVPDMPLAIRQILGKVVDAMLHDAQPFPMLETWFLENFPVLWPQVREILKNPLFTHVDEAQSALLALVQKHKRQVLRKELRKKRHLTEESAKAKDYSAVIQGIKEQSSLLMSHKAHKKDDEPQQEDPGKTVSKAKLPRGLVERKPLKIEGLEEDSFFDLQEDWMS